MSANEDLLRRSLAAVWHPCTQMKQHEPLPLVPIARGEGAWLVDFDGRRIPDPYFLSDNQYDFNRQFPYQWGPEHEQEGAGDYPGSAPETRAARRWLARSIAFTPPLSASRTAAGAGAGSLADIRSIAARPSP